MYSYKNYHVKYYLGMKKRTPQPPPRPEGRRREVRILKWKEDLRETKIQKLRNETKCETQEAG